MGAKYEPAQEKFDPSLICPKCKFNSNLKGSKHCVICSSELVRKAREQLIAPSSKSSLPGSSLPRHSATASGVQLIFKNKTRDCLNFIRTTRNPEFYRELQRPVNLIGLFVVGFLLLLWANYLFVIEPNRKSDEEIIPKVVKNPVPEGLFSYGGASIFAPLVANGINAGIEARNPGFELRYTKPLDRDYSSERGIEMLVDGEISFAFNDRALTDAEYQKAKLREASLKQIPVAIDGVVVFGNNDLKVSQLNLEQVRKIFTGEINNWNQIDPKVKNLPITPLAVNNEGLEVLGIKQVDLAPTVIYTDNYTQALRKVIATPGSISFASASLVQNQKLIKMFELADGRTSNYIKPAIDDKLNLKAFKNGSYPLTRRIFLVYRNDETLDRKAGIAYSNYVSSPKGQEIVERSGFVPIYEVNRNVK